jgi:DNA end-binding protein Ku
LICQGENAGKRNLIRRKSKPFDSRTFEDTYEKALHELIEAKAEHRQVRQIEEPQQGARVINLMDALRRSIGKSERAAKQRAGSSGRRKSSRKPGRSARTARNGRRKAA